MYEHTARKRFGQNFLIDNYIIAEIIAQINPQPKQHILEIGPGHGALTKLLVNSGATIDAVELDRDLAHELKLYFTKHNNFTLHSADILEFDLAQLITTQTPEKLRVVGNLPYNISTPLLFKLFSQLDLIQDMYFMLQKEVAERLVAAPHNKEYGRMSVMAQYYCQIQIVLDVPPHAFDPAPKVDSSIVVLKPRHTKNICNPSLLQKITTLAFNQRRKTIANSLKSVISAAELQEIGIDPSSRAENITLEGYTKISNYLQD